MERAAPEYPASNPPSGQSAETAIARASVFLEAEVDACNCDSAGMFARKSAGRLLAAWWACDEMTKLAEEDGVEWSATHAYYANMGGFGVRFDESTRAAEAKIVVNDAPEGDCAGVRQQRDGSNITTATGGDTTLQKESITPLYRNSRLLASQSQLQLGASTGNGSIMSGNQDVGAVSAILKDSNADTPLVETVPEHPDDLEKTETEETVTPKPTVTTTRLRSKSFPKTTTDESGLPADDFNKPLFHAPQHSGTEDWLPNSTNLHIVRCAMQSLSTQPRSIRLRSRQRNLLALQGSIWILDAAQLRLACKTSKTRTKATRSSKRSQ